mmetsp:Transcript_43971/g.50604  ORF Transcript_43971/g.50604 Transcript_43971/m.50604 type:complete len:229 (+) Transcript_43971:147-833(+)
MRLQRKNRRLKKREKRKQIGPTKTVKKENYQLMFKHLRRKRRREKNLKRRITRKIEKLKSIERVLVEVRLVAIAREPRRNLISLLTKSHPINLQNQRSIESVQSLAALALHRVAQDLLRRRVRESIETVVVIIAKTVLNLIIAAIIEFREGNQLGSGFTIAKIARDHHVVIMIMVMIALAHPVGIVSTAMAADMDTIDGTEKDLVKDATTERTVKRQIARESNRKKIR